MDRGWDRTTLAEVAEESAYGFTASADPDGTGPRFVRITDLVGSLRWENVPASDGVPARLDKYLLRDGDVLIGRTGANVGVALELVDPPESIFASYLVRFRLDRRKVARGFMGLLVRSPWWKAYVRSAQTGSGQPQLNARLMGEFSFPLPDLDEQSRIVEVIHSLENKIENNRKLAKTLEEIAATLFRARFVDFVGHDDLIESEIGPIPAGWKVLPVGELVETRGGTTPSTRNPEYWEGGTVAWATPKDLSGMDSPILRSTSRKITEAGLGKISSGLLPRGTVLLSSRAPVGYTAVTDIDLAVNQGFIAMPPSDQIPSSYILFWLRENMRLIESNAGGTTFAEISKKAFRPLPFLVPPQEDLDTFALVAEPLFARIAAADRESETLVEIRDTLLPKLISGEIRVPEVEEVIEEAV